MDKMYVIVLWPCQLSTYPNALFNPTLWAWVLRNLWGMLHNGCTGFWGSNRIKLVYLSIAEGALAWHGAMAPTKFQRDVFGTHEILKSMHTGTI